MSKATVAHCGINATTIRHKLDTPWKQVAYKPAVLGMPPNLSTWTPHRAGGSYGWGQVASGPGTWERSATVTWGHVLWGILQSRPLEKPLHCRVSEGDGPTAQGSCHDPSENFSLGVSELTVTPKQGSAPGVPLAWVTPPTLLSHCPRISQRIWIKRHYLGVVFRNTQCDKLREKRVLKFTISC